MNASVKAIYVGLFRHNLDAKNRLTIPSKWRFAGDEGDVYLGLPHPDGYISVLPPAEKDRLYDKVLETKMGDRKAQDFMHRFFAVAHSFGCDKQGRINLDAGLVAHAGLTKEAVLVGTMSRFAIWSPERWDIMNQRTAGDSFGDLMRELDF
ncbi:MAG TPA: mraZ [Opitutales bacterium]|nr:mraZ [Opitutales bacterium]